MNLLSRFKKKNGTFTYAMSLAASWAWGVSLIVGMQIMQKKGLIPFLIWASANSLALPLFGLIAFRIKRLEIIVNSKVVLVFTTIIMIYCQWIQMNAMYEVLSKTDIIPNVAAKSITIIISLIMVVALSRDGLIRTILINNPLWLICYILLLVLIAYGFLFKVDTYKIVKVVSDNDISWSLNSCLILFSGPIMNIGIWQMAEKLRDEKEMKAFNLAGLLFGIYMIFVAFLSIFSFNGYMKLMFILLVSGVALSTMDSAIVGMHKIKGKKIGCLIAMITVLCWIIVEPMGVMGLWTTMGNMRKYVAAVCIIVAVVWQYRFSKKTHSAKV